MQQHLQYQAGARASSREKIYQDLGFESLQQGGWYRRSTGLFYNVIKD